jgi:hypothetical protein
MRQQVWQGKQSLLPNGWSSANVVKFDNERNRNVARTTTFGVASGEVSSPEAGVGLQAVAAGPRVEVDRLRVVEVDGPPGDPPLVEVGAAAAAEAVQGLDAPDGNPKGVSPAVRVPADSLQLNEQKPFPDQPDRRLDQFARRFETAALSVTIKLRAGNFGKFNPSKN